MRKFRFLIIISLIISCLFAFASCNDTEVLTPPKGLEIEQTTLTLSWKGVTGARLYTISIAKDGEEPREVIGSKTYYSLTSLAEGHYTIKVRANGKEGISRDSDWSESILFDREKESGMTFALINGNTEYEVTGKGIATGDIVIPDTYRGLPVTSIGKKAFFNKSDVSSVVIGKNVRSIGEYAFANCSYITSVTIPEGLTFIGESAFASCRLLNSKIVIPEGVTNIPKNAFAYCVSLQEVVFSDNITRIEASAFTDCGNLESLDLPEKLEYIGTLAFSSCKSVSSLVLGSSIREIDDYAFSEMVELTSVVIPGSVERIGECAFYRCASLKDVQLGAGVKEIDNGAFFDTKLWTDATSDVYVGKWFIGCKDAAATSISFRNDTVGIAAYALYGNNSLSQIILPDSVKLIGKGAFGQMAINVAVIGSGVVEIGDEAFANCKQLTTVYLGSFDSKNTCIAASSLQKIGDYAFRECGVLESIEMPSTLKVVGSYAFRDTALFRNAGSSSQGVVYADNWVVDYVAESIDSTVVLRDGTVGIANYAFYNCSSLVSITMPDSVKTVGRAAFYDCSGLMSVKLPGTLEVIEDYTFYRCRSLQLFTLPPMLTSIGRSAFYKCATASVVKDSDTEEDILYIPSDVQYIGDYAFYNCGYSEHAPLGDEEYYNIYGIDSVVFRGAVKYIGANAFYNFISLKSVDLGETEEIGERAFYKCDSLVSVDFGASLKIIGDKAFYKCEKLVEVKLPETLTTIGSYAFYRCESIENIDLGGAATIGSFAFYGNYNVTKLVIPSTVTFIGKQAFRNCKGLTAVVLSSSIETVEQHAFYGCSSLTLYVAFDKAPEAWHKYWNSSYRPVVYNCVLSEDASYVLYVEKGTISNLTSNTTLSDPIREGYTFAGWGNSSTADAPAYTSANLAEAENGRKLYAIWVEEQN